MQTPQPKICEFGSSVAPNNHDVFDRCSDFVWTFHSETNQLLWANTTLLQWLNLKGTELCEINADQLPLPIEEVWTSPLSPESDSCVMIRIARRPDPLRSDPLTLLPDRKQLVDRLNAMLEGRRSSDHAFAILFIDLDQFKQVNDSLGHLVGDTVLQEVASSLKQSLRTGDTVYRYGGDEFVCIVSNIQTKRQVAPVIERIQSLFTTVSFAYKKLSPQNQPPGFFIAKLWSTNTAPTEIRHQPSHCGGSTIFFGMLMFFIGELESCFGSLPVCSAKNLVVSGVST